MKLKHTLLAAALISSGAFFFAAPASAADNCKAEITGNDLMQYDKKELKFDASCATVEITLKHIGKLAKEAMGHNWVLVNTADAMAVANDGLSAGLAANYIKAGDKRVIAHTKVLGGGESDTIKIPASALKKGGDYSYECTFPGHVALMKGKFIFG
jgi:azurin